MTSESIPMDDALTLRLVWPQWQGAGADMADSSVPEVRRERARRGYEVGSRVLDAVLPAHSGPTEIVSVDAGDAEEGSTGGIESRSAILSSLRSGLAALARTEWDRVLTLGGECAVGVAPVAELARRHGDDLAVIWIDSHPDADTPDTGYDGFHAMAASVLLGHGDQEVLDLLPATVGADRFAYAGLHDGEDDALGNVRDWGLPVFAPEDLRKTTQPLLDWLAATGASRVALHLDVDVVDSDEAALGLGRVPGGLTREQVRRVIADLGARADIVGLTIAEFVPRSLLQLQEMLDGLPLVGSDGLD
ncbi:arginase family protein [Kocuria palustris]|uniref:arginase family protein n=1 Tax=Kocuria palustris TaxID=71999 RepID=UPI0016427D87|nr:arginase family protein [Kocuria palustris]